MSIFVLYTFGIMFGICEFGQRMTNAFERIDNEFESFDWHLFPLEMQRMLPPILMMAQAPVVLNYFGSMSATREYAKKVSFHSTRNILWY